MSNTSFTFAPVDYALFVATLGFAFIIGIYYAYKERITKRTDKSNDYLNASRSLSLIPVAISLCVTLQSPSHIITTPTEIYLYGSLVIWAYVFGALSPILAAYIFIPAYFRSEITTVHEYLKLRFNRRVQILGALAYLCTSMTYAGITMYSSALAIQAVTGFSLWTSIITTGVVCTSYTTFGGLRGVVWTDVFLSFIMFGGILAVIIKGSEENGGLSEVWRVNVEDGRIDIFRFDTDIRIRHTFWTIVIGDMIASIGVYGTSMTPVQRYLSCKTQKDAIKSVYVNIVAHTFLNLFVFLLSLVVYSQFKGCDPIARECIEKADQVLALAVIELFHDNPGIPGLFMSAISAASLSTISSAINSLGAATMDNLVKPFTKVSDRSYLYISKGIVLTYGLVSIGLAALMTNTTELYEIAGSLFTLIMGSTLAMFTLAMQFPFANWMGAAGGLVCGIASAAWLFIGKQTIRQSNAFTRRLSLSTDLCNTTCIEQDDDRNFTTPAFPNTHPTKEFYGMSTIASDKDIYDDDVPFYTISYRYIGWVGFFGCLIPSIIVSLLTGGWRDRHNVDPKLLRPFFDLWLFRCWIPSRVRKLLRFGIEWNEDDTNIDNKSEKVNVIREEKDVIFNHEENMLVEESNSHENEKDLTKL